MNSRDTILFFRLTFSFMSVTIADARVVHRLVLIDRLMMLISVTSMNNPKHNSNGIHKKILLYLTNRLIELAVPTPSAGMEIYGMGLILYRCLRNTRSEIS